MRRLLLPKDPLADRAAVVEIRAGTGGDEAGLFAGDLFRMYTRYAERRGWKVEVMDVSEGEVGGYKEIVLRGRGGRTRTATCGTSPACTACSACPRRRARAASTLRRRRSRCCPRRRRSTSRSVTRTCGSTSTAPRGRAASRVNTTDSAVRITHIPTGVVVTCQDEKSQHKNKAKALKVLRSRLLDAKIAEQEAERARERKTQVGTRRPLGEDPDVQLPAGPRDRSPHRLHALQAPRGPGWRPGRADRGPQARP